MCGRGKDKLLIWEIIESGEVGNILKMKQRGSDERYIKAKSSIYMGIKHSVKPRTIVNLTKAEKEYSLLPLVILRIHKANMVEELIWVLKVLELCGMVRNKKK